MPGIQSEDSFEVAVMRLARLYQWCGYHVRFSQASTRGIHTLKRDGHMDGWGWPDWVFVKPGYPLKYRELKTDVGRQSPHQKHWEQLLRAAGVDVGVWRPRMLAEITRELSGGPPAFLKKAVGMKVKVNTDDERAASADRSR